MKEFYDTDSLTARNNIKSQQQENYNNKQAIDTIQKNTNTFFIQRQIFLTDSQARNKFVTKSTERQLLVTNKFFAARKCLSNLNPAWKFIYLY